MKDRNRIVTRLAATAMCVALACLATPLARGQGAPAVTLSSPTVNFGNQLASTTSSAQTVTLTNSGNAPLTFAASGITVQGAFAETNTCPANPGTLAAGSSCTLSITFAPTVGGPTAGLIEIMDNATPATQAIALGGTGEDFSLSASPDSTTVTAGSSGTYTITVTPVGGFNAAVSFACGPLPTGVGCSFSPASVTPNGSSITTSLSVSTTGSGSVPAGRPRRAPPAAPMLLWAGLLSVLVGFFVMRRGRRMPAKLALAALVLAVALSATLAAPACGGGSSSSGSGSTATPAGTYMFLVDGSTPAGSGSLTNPAEVTIVVQ